MWIRRGRRGDSVGCLVSGSCVHAQAAASSDSLDLGVSFVALRSLEAGTGQDFWKSGGSVEVGANAFHVFGPAANIAGVRSGSIGSSGILLCDGYGDLWSTVSLA